MMHCRDHFDANILAKTHCNLYRMCFKVRYRFSLTYAFLYKVKMCFLGFPHFGRPRPVFPGRYLSVFTAVNTGDRRKPSTMMGSP